MRTLRWRHRGWFARTWDLEENGAPIATLRQRGWGFNADLDHAGRRMTLLMTGFLRWTIELRDERGLPLATMRMGWRGQGDPAFADGRRFRWDAENWWGTRWSIDDPERGARVADVHMDAILKMNARIDIHDGAPSDDALVPLLALTWIAVVISAQAASSAGGG